MFDKIPQGYVKEKFKNTLVWSTNAKKKYKELRKIMNWRICAKLFYLKETRIILTNLEGSLKTKKIKDNKNYFY